MMYVIVGAAVAAVAVIVGLLVMRRHGGKPS
jgi:high-affinity Fe2+/Pb2+ permease